MLIAVQNRKERLFSVSELKDRGWTDTAVKRFLPEPDDTRPNPRYSQAGAPMKFYLIARVKRMERTKGWQAWQVGVAERRAAAKRGVSTKEQKLLEQVESIEITVPAMSAEDLARRAVEHYNALWSGRKKRASLSDSSEFLARISVNYLLHQLTEYDEHLDKIAGKTGAHDARTDLRSCIYSAIAGAYPHLADECLKQGRDRRTRESLARFY